MSMCCTVKHPNGRLSTNQPAVAGLAAGAPGAAGAGRDEAPAAAAGVAGAPPAAGAPAPADAGAAGAGVAAAPDGQLSPRNTGNLQALAKPLATGGWGTAGTAVGVSPGRLVQGRMSARVRG
jgi:hypothetical protein